MAQECRKKRFYGEADALWKAVIALDPNHAAGRKALRYFKRRGGAWYQSKGYHQPKNRGKQGLESARMSSRQELESLRDGMLDLLEASRGSLGARRREGELALLTELLPQDAALRSAIGEELHEGQWMLSESVTALHRRRAFPHLAAACLRMAPEPREARIRPEESALGIPWDAAKQTDALRVIGSTGELEVTHAARVSHAVGDYFRTVLAGAGKHRAGFTLYLLENSHKAAMIANWPGLDQTTRKGLAAADGGWLGQNNRLAEWGPSSSRRVDGAARQSLGTMLMDSFGITGRQGWAWEGIGLYMVHELVGTRLTWFFESEGYQPQLTGGLWARLQAPRADWLAEARTLLESADRPSLVYLLGRTINAMREEDVLLAYALAAYLLEGHPKLTPIILTRIGAGEQPVRVFEDILGYSVQHIESRLVRFLDETR
ncbi:MAG TPA: hypothetical protein EYG30_01995 [Planctomycetes bacterium]|nr:hypothetical protein [Planctomycetota bacterium]HIL51011.1 hypothetical protein [Planctomycetota bacterium]